MVNGPQSPLVQSFLEPSLPDIGAFFEEQDDLILHVFFLAISSFFELQDLAFEQKPSMLQLFTFAKKVL